MSSSAASSTSTPADNSDKHVHNLYEGAKGVWAWGKGLSVVGSAFGMAEGVAQAALGVVGTNLQDVDHNLIEPKLVQPLDSFTAPAVNAVVHVLMKTTDTVVPPIQSVLDKIMQTLQIKRILGQQEDDDSATDGPENTTVTTTGTSTNTKSTKGKGKKNKTKEAPELATPVPTSTKTK